MRVKSEAQKEAFFDAMIARAREMGREREARRRAERWGRDGEPIRRTIAEYHALFEAAAEAQQWCYRLPGEPASLTPDQSVQIAENAQFVASHCYLQEHRQLRFEVKSAKPADVFAIDLEKIHWIPNTLQFRFRAAELPICIREVAGWCYDAWVFGIIDNRICFMHLGRAVYAGGFGELVAEPAVEISRFLLPTYEQLCRDEEEQWKYSNPSTAKRGVWPVSGWTEPEHESPRQKSREVRRGMQELKFGRRNGREILRTRELQEEVRAFVYHFVRNSAGFDSETVMRETVGILTDAIAQKPAWHPGACELRRRMRTA